MTDTTPVITVHPIVGAIQALRSKTKRIVHDANNPHAQYTYVSIDKYYEQIAKLANAEGLVWRASEKGYEIIGSQGKNKDRTYVKVTIQYDVFHGVTEALDYMRMTLMLPMEGPQTTGIVFSYAEKVFLKTLGCVPTGEEGDGDNIKPEPMITQVPKTDDPIQSTAGQIPHDPITGEITESPLKPEQAELVSAYNKIRLPEISTKKLTDKGVATVEEIFKVFIPGVKTRADLTDFHAMNIAALEKVKTLDPAAHDRIKAMFNGKLKELKEKR